MEPVAKIHTTEGALETVYKQEKYNGAVIYRLERASINGHSLPPIEVRRDRNNVHVRSIGSATVNVNVNEVSHFSGSNFTTVELEPHTPNVGGQDASGSESRMIQASRMYQLCKYATGASCRAL